MKMVKEFQDAHGNITRQIIDGDSKTSFDQAGELLSDFNESAGRSLSPFSFKGGFSVSGSWMLFLFMVCIPEDWARGTFGLLWLLSLFVRFR